MLYMVRGIPGSGKTTYAKERFPDVPMFEADMFFEKDGEYKFNPKQLWLAHKWCKDKVEECLKEGKDVVVSNTFTTLKEMRPYWNMVEQYDQDIKVIRMNTYYGSTHNVPEENMQKMRDRFCDVWLEEHING